MQVILLHPRFNRAKSITLGAKHLVLMIAAFLLAVLLAAALLYYVTLRYAGSLPFLGAVATANTAAGVTDKDKYLKENLAAMAVKLGEMQAQIMRLDALGERVQGLAGVKPEEFNFKDAPGRGGPEITTAPSHELNMSELQSALDAFQKDVDHRSDYLNVVETNLMS